MLSVPSKDGAPSVFSKILELKPELNAKTLIVHRLDMDTSGVLLLAKDKKTHRDLQEQFLQHTIKKRYIALLEGHIDSDSGTISLPLSCNFEDRPRHMVDYDNGKDAVTLYHVINRSDSSTRIAFYPQTGRTHQLRVHSAHPEGLGHPIIGDPLYGHKSTRLFLHAESIEFTHPHTGQRMTIESPCEF
jgi:tRNA pseudouridine32 synthase/23S rRNA pseudouridine746 synthase